MEKNYNDQELHNKDDQHSLDGDRSVEKTREFDFSNCKDKQVIQCAKKNCQACTKSK